MRNRPGPQVCKVCALDDYLTWQVEAPGLFSYTCSNPGHAPYTWLTTGKDPLKTGTYDGIAAELGVYDDLVELFDDPDEWVEYGVVEYRYGIAHPAEYKRLVDAFGHTALGPTQNSASAFLGTCLGMLEQQGALAKRTCKATGYWSYNGTVTAWARPGADPSGHIVSWVEFATASNLDPNAWTIAGTN